MTDRDMEKSIAANRKRTYDAIALLEDKAKKVRGANGACLTLISVALRGIVDNQNGARDYQTRKIFREEMGVLEFRLYRGAAAIVGSLILAGLTALVVAHVKGWV